MILCNLDIYKNSFIAALVDEEIDFIKRQLSGRSHTTRSNLFPTFRYRRDIKQNY